MWSCPHWESGIFKSNVGFELRDSHAQSVNGIWEAKMKQMLLRRRGFSLMELLVIVAILAVLAALLFPNVSQFRARGNAVKCSANLKNIGAAVLAFTSDNGGILPVAFPPEIDGCWLTLIEPYMGTFAEPNDPDRPAWQQCPDKKFKKSDRWAVGYGWNFLHLGYTHAGMNDWGSGSSGGDSRLGSIDQPSRTVMAADSKDFVKGQEPGHEDQQNALFYGSGWTPNQLARRHAGKGNYLFCDGHIETLTPEQALADDEYIMKKHKPDR